MLILPDRHAPVGKILQPHWRKIWSPSQRACIYGIDNRTRFAVVARRSHDKSIHWRGIFDDREDADAFLYALACGSLIYEHELWRLPQPGWHPGVGADVDLYYEFVSQTALTANPGSNQTISLDPTWDNSNNTIDTIGGGASGGADSSGGHNTGGGGGAWNHIANFLWTPFNQTYQIGTGGAAAVSTGGAAVNGNDGNNTWFGSITFGPSDVASVGGTHGVSGAGSQNGGAGGVGTSGRGTSNNNGGRGGNLTGASGTGASGGGGAAGLNAAGGAAGDSSSTAANTMTAGGAGDGGSGGAGGGTGGGAGSPGNEWSTAGVGSGGGGGGNSTGAANVTGASGGNYGGGGGGARCGSGTATSGAGIQGVIVLTWTPLNVVISADLSSMSVAARPRRRMIPYH